MGLVISHWRHCSLSSGISNWLSCDSSIDAGIKCPFLPVSLVANVSAGPWSSTSKQWSANTPAGSDLFPVRRTLLYVCFRAEQASTPSWLLVMGGI